MITKKCTKCGDEKPIYEFYFYKSTNRHSPECKDCKRKMNKSYTIAKLKADKYIQKFNKSIMETAGKI